MCLLNFIEGYEKCYLLQGVHWQKQGSKENGHFEGCFNILDWRRVWLWYNCKINGVGRELRKTKGQVQKTASRESCLAGATGSSISNELPQTLERDKKISPSSELYNIWFISQAPEPVQLPTLEEYPKPSSFFSPPSGYALRKNSGKRLVFTLA